MTYYVLALTRDYRFRNGMSVLAHEATHTAVKLLNDHRLMLDVDPENGHAEPLAYLVGTRAEFGMDALWAGKNEALSIGPLEGMMDKVWQEKKSVVSVSR